MSYPFSFCFTFSSNLYFQILKTKHFPTNKTLSVLVLSESKFIAPEIGEHQHSQTYFWLFVKPIFFKDDSIFTEKKS